MALYSGPGLPAANSKNTSSINQFPQIKTDTQLIRDSITTILLTRPGERLFLPHFGCRLSELVFEPNDLVTKAAAEEYITSAIKAWEPRVLLRSVQIDISEETLMLHLDMIIKRLNIAIVLPIEIAKPQDV